MKYIAHRGNVFGPCPEKENDPIYILNTLVNYSCSVEMDLWFIDNTFYSGHDEASYILEKGLSIFDSFTDRIYFHAKNLAALKELINLGMICFWHEFDKCCLVHETNEIWCYPGIFEKYTIACLPEQKIGFENVNKLKNCVGICTDYVAQFRGILDET